MNICKVGSSYIYQSWIQSNFLFRTLKSDYMTDIIDIQTHNYYVCFVRVCLFRAGCGEWNKYSCSKSRSCLSNCGLVALMYLIHDVCVCLCSQAFTGNSNSESAVRHELQQGIVARFLRLVPLDWSEEGRIGLRIEVYGCSYCECTQTHAHT